jgi:hypothetical protein
MTIAANGADVSDNYVIIAASDGNVYRLNRADLTTHDTVDFSGSSHFDECKVIIAITDDVWFAIYQGSTHDATMVMLESDGTETVIGSIDTNGIIGLQNRIPYVGWYVDKFLYWYNANWLGGYSTQVRSGPFLCP